MLTLNKISKNAKELYNNFESDYNQKYNNPIEKHESKFITSKDYEKPDINLKNKFYEYKNKYIPDSIIIEQAEADYDKIIKYCKSKNAKPHEILTVFDRYWKNIPVNEMLNWMQVNNKNSITAYKSYYNARKYSKIIRR